MNILFNLTSKQPKIDIPTASVTQDQTSEPPANSLSGQETESDDDCTEEMQFKGALKITRIKNRKYIRMPNFPKRAVVTLKNWLYEHLENPYPTDKEKV